MPPQAPVPGEPPVLMRLLAKASTRAIARMPATWRVLRRPTKRFWESRAATWDERVGARGDQHVAPLRAACDAVEPGPKTILEIGTGTAVGAVMLAERFTSARVHAVDLSAAMIEAARAKIPAEVADRVELSVADAAAIPLPDGGFDLVAQLNVPVYLDEVARLLRPGGWFVVASSYGSATPYHTPHGLLRKGCAQHGLELAGSGRAGEGTYFVARKPAA